MKKFVLDVLWSTLKFIFVFIICVLLWFVHDKHNTDMDDSMNLLPVIAFGIAFISERIGELKDK